MASLLLLLLLLVLAATLGNACGVPPPLSDVAPFPTVPYPFLTPSPLVKDHWSERAILPRLPRVVPDGIQTNCPHALGGLQKWHEPATWPGGQVPSTSGLQVTLPENTRVLVMSCSVPANVVFGLVTIPATSSLIFDDAPISFQARGFQVFGNVQLGSDTCRLRNKITITLHGARTDQPLPGPHTTKGFNVTGSLEVHGAKYTPTWTRLAYTAMPGATWIIIQDCPNWEQGQRIVITTTELKDSRDFNRNEEMTIKSIATTVVSNVCAVELTTPLQYKHYGGAEYQAEVALLSRRIVIQGDELGSEPTDITPPLVCRLGTTNSTFPCPDRHLTGFGAHIIVNGKASKGRLQGVELYRVGQTNVLGRYPIHFHMLKNLTSSGNFYVTDSSVHRSFFRCFAIHGTYTANIQNGVLLQENTAYDAIGHCYFIEDGVEEGHSIMYNQGAFIHPLGPYYEASYKLFNGQVSNIQSFGSQDQEWYMENAATLLLPSDISASVYYFTSSYNRIVGNVASGGANGFAFPTLSRPIKLHEQLPEFTNFCPRNRPFLLFSGNSAHSTGHWQRHSAGVYIGGELKHATRGGLLTYTAGRALGRDTCADASYGSETRPTSGCPANLLVWAKLDNIKVFLANRGIQHWGSRSEITRFEGRSLGLSMNVFGQVHIDQMLMECRSPGHLPQFFAGCPSAPSVPTTNVKWGICNDRDWTYWNEMQGFQFYDVGQQHIVTNSEFRNCNDSWQHCVYGPAGGKCSRTSSVFLLLTHSDQFVPSLMQSTRGIRYGQGIDPDNLWRFSTTLASANTVAGRLQSWVDEDGSASQVFSGRRVLMGSTWAGPEWWRVNADCVQKQQMWICPMSAQDSAASIYIESDETQARLIGDAYCENGGPRLPCPFVANVTHFGRSEFTSLPLALNGKITGPIVQESSGWFVRFLQGTPRELVIQQVQVLQDDVLLVAIPYPVGTQITIKARGGNWCVVKSNPSPWDSVCEQAFLQVPSLEQVRTSRGGDMYFVDPASGILYMRIVQRPEGSFGRNSTYVTPWPSVPTAANFSRDGITIVVPTWGNSWGQFSYRLTVTANCRNAVCAPQPNVQIPAAMFPSGITAAPTSDSPTKLPTTSSPFTKTPTSQAPNSRSPTTIQPTTSSPTTKSPSSTSPTSQAPSSHSPTSVQTTTSSPVTKSPSSGSPTSRAPSSQSPSNQVTASPSSRSPTSQSPATSVPSSKAPTKRPTPPTRRRRTKRRASQRG